MESLPAINELRKLSFETLDDTAPPMRRQTITHTSEMYKKSAKASALKHRKSQNIGGSKSFVSLNQRAMSFSV